MHFYETVLEQGFDANLSTTDLELDDLNERKLESNTKDFTNTAEYMCSDGKCFAGSIEYMQTPPSVKKPQFFNTRLRPVENDEPIVFK